VPYLRLKSEANWGQMLDLDLLMQDSYEHTAASGCQPERAHQRRAEKNCSDAILTISYKLHV